jgi:hypothetical protein
MEMNKKRSCPFIFFNAEVRKPVYDRGHVFPYAGALWLHDKALLYN